MAPHKSSTTDLSATTDEEKYWNGSVLDRGPWISQLPRTLAADNPNFRTYWEEGYIIEKGKGVSITQSPSHSYHLHIQNVKQRKFSDPCPTKSFSRIDTEVADGTMPDEAASSYRTGFATLKQFNRTLHDSITAYIRNEKLVEDLEEESGGDFVKLIKYIIKENADAEGS